MKIKNGKDECQNNDRCDIQQEQQILAHMMKIVHPSPEFEKYNKALQFIGFPISMCYAIENVWITALMIAHDTPNIVDSFIWILPNIISILLRPTLITYVHSVVSARHAQISLILIFMFGGAIGCFVVGQSALNFSYPWNLIVCAIGWTTMGVCFEMATYFSQKTKQRLDKLGYKQIGEQKNYSTISGQIVGYSLSFLLCFYKAGKTKKKFFSQACIIYWVAAAIVSCYCIITYLVMRDKIEVQSGILKSALQNKRTVAQYLPGYHELKKSSKSDRWLLALHFALSYIVDTLLIYGSMWIIWTYEEANEKEGVAYNLGMKEGSLVLLTFSIVAYSNFTRFLTKNIALERLINYFKIYLIVVCVCASLLFMHAGHHFIFSLAFLIGIADTIYNNSIYPQVVQSNPVFESCVELISSMQKIFILCPMPFFIMIVLNKNDIDHCLVCIPMVVGIVLAMSLVCKDKEIVASEVDKVKLTKHH